ncbi:MAG TPA: shikimate dehydrogenase [Thiobacillaceae bacterium]|nr:shikimate dehydrogenase [Thiobacillaceae bacterium]HNU65162.1 shikimate dehydrogenase [Thiobacillaceae bacterium]
MTDHYAVFGNPIAHSMSPLIHAAFARQTGQDMDYTALLAPLDGFAETVRAFQAGGGRGANVTVPFKEQAHALARRRTPRAEAAGAVNTLLFGDADILGDNTDGVGLVRDLMDNLGIVPRGLRILLMGAGGAARGVVLPLLEAAPRSLFIVNRTPARAVELARSFADRPGLAGGGYEDLPGRQFDLVINATAAGLTGDLPPLPDATFADGAWAYDMLYGRVTPFLDFARQRGARVADGLGMLVEQAAEAFYLWRGVRPDTGAVMRLLRAA